MESSPRQPWGSRRQRKFRRISWLVTGAVMTGHAFAFDQINPYEEMCEIGFHGGKLLISHLHVKVSDSSLYAAAIVNDTWWIHGGYVGYETSSDEFVAPSMSLPFLPATSTPCLIPMTFLSTLTDHALCRPQTPTCAPSTSQTASN